jgi:hypothetical protein
VHRNHPDRLGRIQRTAATKTDQPITARLAIAGRALVDERNWRVWDHLIKEDEVYLGGFERCDCLIDQTGFDQTAVGHQHRALHPQRTHFIGQTGNCTQTVFDHSGHHKGTEVDHRNPLSMFLSVKSLCRSD